MGVRQKIKFYHTNKWYMHNPESILENETHQVLRDFEIQTDHLISTGRPDLIIVKKSEENLLNNGLRNIENLQRKVRRQMKTTQTASLLRSSRRCPWCNGYRRRKWTRQHEFKSWTRLIAFRIALIPLGKVWIQLLSLQQWVNSRAD